MIPSAGAAFVDRMGVDAPLLPDHSGRLVSAIAVSSRSSRKLCRVATSHRLRPTPSAVVAGVPRSVAIWRLAATIPELIMSKPIKHSVAVLIRNGKRILTLRRPDDDDELPGIWGLPAGSLRSSETLGDLVTRIGDEKLGVPLSPVRKISEGVQDRPAYRLEMELWEAEMEGEPTVTDWKWDSIDALQAGKEAGSLCCTLALKRP
jgi:8-oxo-dGTP diphosphatase